MVNSLVSVVIDDFHVVGVSVDPSETDPPLIIDPDAELAFAGAFQRLKPAGWWHAQVFQHRGVAEHAQLPTSDSLDIGRQPAGRRSTPDLFRFLVSKVPDHETTITFPVI